MPRNKGCRICKFWDKYPYRISDKELFEKKIREGTSLRKLELLLEAFGLKARKDLINRHIHECMDTEVHTQRRIEKKLKQGIGKRIQEYFTRPREEDPLECPHTLQIPFFDILDEQVKSRCQLCGKIISNYGIDPHETRTRQLRDPRNRLIYDSLRRGK